MSDQTFRLLEALVLRFWSVVDEISSQPGETLFTSDGVLEIGSFKAEGTVQLSGYFVGRRQKSSSQSRATRHVVSNLREVEDDGSDGTLDCLVTVFSSYGTLPAPLGPPSTVADFRFACERNPDGEWLLRRVVGRPVFVGADTPDPGATQRMTEGGHG